MKYRYYGGHRYNSKFNQLSDPLLDDDPEGGEDGDAGQSYRGTYYYLSCKCCQDYTKQ